VLPMSERMRRLVSTQAAAPELFKTAREEGMRTLREAAVEKIFHGVTTTAEMLRVTGKGDGQPHPHADGPHARRGRPGALDPGRDAGVGTRLEPARRGHRHCA